MAVSFPASIDSFTNPSSGDPQNSPSHSQQHSNANDAIEALEAKVGADGSAVTTSHDYKITQLENGVTNLTTKTSTGNIDATDHIIIADASGGAITLTLPAVSGLSGKEYIIKRINSGTNNVTIDAQSGETIDGFDDYILATQNDSVRIVCDGSAWYIV